MDTDRRLEQLLQRLENAGIHLEQLEVDAATADQFDPNYLSKIVD